MTAKKAQLQPSQPIAALLSLAEKSWAKIAARSGRS
jgi:hypothetical protein